MYKPTWKHVGKKQHAYGAAARAVIPHHKVLAKTAEEWCERLW